MERSNVLNAFCWMSFVLLAAATSEDAAKPNVSQIETETQHNVKHSSTKLLVDSSVEPYEEQYGHFADQLAEVEVDAAELEQEEAIDGEQPLDTQQYELAEESLESTEPNSAEATTEILDDVDARSAYINNQFISDDNPQVNPPLPPLYEMLQQQMQQVLADTGPAYAVYSLQERPDVVTEQKPPLKPIFSYGQPDDAEEYDEGNSSTYDYVEATPAKVENVQPNLSGGTVVAALTNKTKPVTASKPSKNVAAAVEQQLIAKPFESQPIVNATLTSSSIVHKHKRRITFRTVSTASQFISTPLADLMLKFSIGIAPPSKPLGANNSNRRKQQQMVKQQKYNKVTRVKTTKVNNSIKPKM